VRESVRARPGWVPPLPGRLSLSWSLTGGPVPAGPAPTGRSYSPLPVRGRSAISSTWQRPTARRPGHSIPQSHQPIPPSLRPGCRVVALWEVEEMARNRAPTTPPTPTRVPTHLRDLPPGEGPCFTERPEEPSPGVPRRTDSICCQFHPTCAVDSAQSARNASGLGALRSLALPGLRHVWEMTV